MKGERKGLRPTALENWQGYRPKISPEDVLTRLRRIGGGLLQLNSIIVAYVVGSQWLRVAGYFSYFGQNLQDVGYSLTDLIISGTIDAVAALLMLGIYLLIEMRQYSHPGWWYYPVILSPPLFSAVFTFYVGPGSNSFSPQEYWMIPLFFVLGFGAIALTARAIVRTTRRAQVMAAVAIAIAGIGLAFLSYHLGRVHAYSATQNASPTGFSTGFGFTTKFFLVVKVVDAPEDSIPSEQCGKLLGMGDGAYVIWYNRSGAPPRDYIAGANGVWRFPIDQTTLAPC